MGKKSHSSRPGRYQRVNEFYQTAVQLRGPGHRTRPHAAQAHPSTRPEQQHLSRSSPAVPDAPVLMSTVVTSIPTLIIPSAGPP